MRYPLEEGVSFKFRCVGCDTGYSTRVPRHGAPFFHRCTTEGCGWTATVQSDPAGLSVGFTAPLPQKPKLTLIEGEGGSR